MSIGGWLSALHIPESPPQPGDVAPQAGERRVAELALEVDEQRFEALAQIGVPGGLTRRTAEQRREEGTAIWVVSFFPEDLSERSDRAHVDLHTSHRHL